VIGKAEGAGFLLREIVDGYDPSADEGHLATQVRGVFKRKRAKLLQDTADTYLEIGDVENAESVAVEAIRLYENGPAEDRAYGSEAMARITVAQARLIQNDADGTHEALQPVLSLPSHHRLNPIAARLKELGSYLRAHRAGKSSVGLQIRGAIREFAETGAQHGLLTT
jgi:hypothetical protein